MHLRILALVSSGVMFSTSCSAWRAPGENRGAGLAATQSQHGPIREAAIGCWLLKGMVDEPTPTLVKLDALQSPASDSVGRRRVQRIDSLGRVQVRDWEGFEVLDWWTSDQKTDTIRIVFNNGLYGSVWALELSANGDGSDLMRGAARGFGDVVPGPEYPQRSVSATRVPCPGRKTPLAVSNGALLSVGVIPIPDPSR